MTTYEEYIHHCVRLCRSPGRDALGAAGTPTVRTGLGASQTWLSFSQALASWIPRFAVAQVSSYVLATPLSLYFETREPFAKMQDGNLSGQVGEPVSIALKRADMDYELIEMPFQRYITLIQRNVVYGCAAGAVKTAEREKAGKFSNVVSIDKPYVLIIRKGDALFPPLQTLQDVLRNSKVRLLIHEGYSYGQFDGLLAQPTRAQVSRLPYDNVGMVRMLSQNMVDTFLMNGGEAQTVLNNVDTRSELAIYPLKDAPVGQWRYLFCSRQVSDETLARVNAFLPKLPAPIP